MGDAGAEEELIEVRHERSNDELANDPANAEEDEPQTTETPNSKKKKGTKWKKVDTAAAYTEYLKDNPAERNAAKGKSKGKGKRHMDGDAYGMREKGKGGGGYGGMEQAMHRPEDDSRFQAGGPAGDGGPGHGAGMPMDGDSGRFGGKGKGRGGGGKGRGGFGGGGKHAGGFGGGMGGGPGAGCQGGKGMMGGPRMGLGGGKGGMKGGPRAGMQGPGDMGMMQGPMDGGCLGSGCGGGMAPMSPGGMEPLDGSRGGPRPPGPQQQQRGLGLPAPGSPKGGSSGGIPQLGNVGPAAQFGVPMGQPGMTFYALPYFVMQTPNGPGSGPQGFPGSPAGGSQGMGLGGLPTMPGALGPMPMGGGPMTPADHQALKSQVQQQIEYYFGKDNLLKDMYLRSKMNEEGWVPIAEIAGFPRVRNMTSDTATLLEAINTSTVLEIHPDSQHVRLRDDPTGWLLPQSPGGTVQGRDRSAAAA